MKTFSWLGIVGIVFLLGIMTAIASSAQTFTSLASFDYTDGAIPDAAMIQATDGNFYGTTNKGGTGTVNGCNKSCGAVFKMTAAGTLTVLHSFDGTDGNGPFGLVQATNGTLYGTTSYGGVSVHDCTSYGSTGACGTIYVLTLAGKLTTLYTFCALTNCADGAIPQAALVQGTDGNFYGTTSWGGTGVCNSTAGPGCGTVFKITPAGVLTTLHSFIGTDGAAPEGPLIQATNGNFYGTTYAGGDLSCGAPDGCGTVFEITPSGKLTTVYSFDGTEGSYPFAGLVQAANGNFYGTTAAVLLNGGPSCTLTGNGYGTVFEITSAGTLTTLLSFDDTNGAYPLAGLVQAANGTLYGSTVCGGANGYGTLFAATSAGALTTLHSFAGTDGALPIGTLLQATNGTFYGSAVFGGNLTCDSPDGCGTVFSLSVGLGPFVETNPTSGKIGAKVVILGNNLTGSTSVTFNGTAATFKVVSSSEITTTVPTGATTGVVKVVTPKKTLKSNLPFRVP